MKFLFDCGAHLGESVDKFRTMIPDIQDYRIYMFEPNPFCFNQIDKNPKYDDCQKRNFAVSNKNWTEKFWGCTIAKTSVGATLEESKAARDRIGPEDYVLVNTIDFSEFISNLVHKEDYTILKLDIEGSEYDVLESLIKNGTIDLIKEIHCEFHGQWLNPSFMEREKWILEKLKVLDKTPSYWDAL